jgi:hypothetical protein
MIHKPRHLLARCFCMAMILVIGLPGLPTPQAFASVETELSEQIAQIEQGFSARDLELTMQPFRQGALFQGVDTYSYFRQNAAELLRLYPSIHLSRQSLSISPEESRQISISTYLVRAQDNQGKSVVLAFSLYLLWEKAGDGWQVIATNRVKMLPADYSSTVADEITQVTKNSQAAGKPIGEPGNIVAGSGSTSVTLEPVADSHVYAYSWKDWNAANWGKYEVLGAGWHPTGGEKRTFIKFDLAGVDLDRVTSAKLRLYRYHLSGNGAKPLGVYRVTEPWTEGRGTYKPASMALPGEITWINQPGFDQRTPLSFSSVDAQPVFIELDVSWLVAAWASGFANHGLMLRPLGRPDASSPEAMFGFYSREHDEIGKRPKLILMVQGSGGGTGNTQTTSVPAVPDTKPKSDSGQSANQVGTPGSGITWDFETGDLRGWTKTGTAFDFQPTFGDNPTARKRGQESAHGGNYWIGGFEKYQGRPDETPGTIQGDRPTGTLATGIITIPGGFLEFLVGGGSSPQTRVELLVDGQSVLSASGRNNETMHAVRWDLTPWTGRSGQIRLVDEASGSWGHINADEFRFSAGVPDTIAGGFTQAQTGQSVQPSQMQSNSENTQVGGAAVGTGATAISGQSEMVTDGNWKTIGTTPTGIDWMYPGFDDSGWQNAVADWRLKPSAAADIAGMQDTTASWIWHPDDPDLVYFRREIELTYQPAEAVLRITADNEYAVYLNGGLIGEDAGDQQSVWRTAESYEIARLLRTGRNVISVVARDLGGGSGLLMDLRFGGPGILPDQRDHGEAAPVPSGQSEQSISANTTGESAQSLVRQGSDVFSQAFQLDDEREREEAFARALSLFQQAQSMGSARAISMIGYMYETGNGVPQDNDIAASYYDEAARGGYAEAYRHLILVQNQLRRHEAAALTFLRYYQAFPQDAEQGFADFTYSPQVLRAVQRELRDTGYYQGAIDGIIGRGTRGAIRQYVTEQLPDELIRSDSGSVNTSGGESQSRPAANDAIQLAFWQSIESSNDPADFDAYLAKWPNGAFADLARNRLNRLSGNQPARNPPASTPPTGERYYTPTRGSAERRAIMDAARGPISAELDQPVIFVVDALRSDGHWVFLQAMPQHPDGTPVNWDATQYAGAWRADMMTDIVMVLLEKRGDRMHVVDYVIGPTDVYWYGWIDQYGLAETFFFPQSAE